MSSLEKFDVELFREWAESISQQIEDNLQQCLLKINSKTKELYLNFNPEVCHVYTKQCTGRVWKQRRIF